MSEKKLLSLDQFKLNDKGEVVIDDRDMAAKIEEAKKQGEKVGEQGWSVGIVVSPT